MTRWEANKLVGKKMTFCDENFDTQVGTIVKIIEYHKALLTIQLECNGKMYTVRRINPLPGAYNIQVCLNLLDD